VVQRLGKSCIPVWTPSLLMRLIIQVTSLDTSSMLLKLFPSEWFLQFWEQVKVWWAHSGPTFEKVLYSCLDAFVVDASDYSDHLIRQLLNASEAFPTEWFLQF
jgi:hypothetical protein